ncbi:hypothetical protein PHMEG_00039701, partial [Phytophthora megakarya]
MPPKKPRYAQEHDALEEVLAGNDIEEVTNEATRIRLQLEFYRRLREAVFVNSASEIEALDEVAAHALDPNDSSQLHPNFSKDPIPQGTRFLLPTPPTLSDRVARERSAPPRHKKQRTAKHQSKATKTYRVQLPTGVPRDVRLAIVGVIDKAATQSKAPFRLAYPWAGQRAWYPPSEFQELHRLHYEVWMTHREVQWLCALYAPCTDTDRRRKAKAGAKKARLQLLSACVETFGYYDFLQRFEDNVHDMLLWLGGKAAKHSASTSRSGTDAETLQEDLVTLFKKKDKTAFHRVISKALDPFSIDENGYATVPELLEQSGALDPEKTSYLRLTTKALARI